MRDGALSWREEEQNFAWYARRMDLRDCSDQELFSSIAKLVGSHRELTAALVAHLGELEERRLHLLAGFSSLYDFCTKALGMSDGEAFRRILAARLGRRFPVVYSLLASGDVNLSTLELLREWMTEENCEELLAAVTRKSKREVQLLLVTRFPRPNRSSNIRRMMIEPLSEASFRVEFTASAALRDKIELCRDLMSHANPGRDLSVVIERGIDLLLVELEKKRLGKTKRPPRAARPKGDGPPDSHPFEFSPFDPASVRTAKASRARISNTVRRQVYERDGLQCTYTEGGRRCEARAFLELDHEVPNAFGGSSDAANLRVLCRAHNQLAAEQAFGRERIERLRRHRQQKSMMRHLRQQRSTAHHLSQQESTAPGNDTAAKNAAMFEKVRVALRRMGFRDHDARVAVIKVARMHAATEHLELERALREALFAATAA